ncbi:MAG TPA: hypothetical protein VF860_06360 [Candidatus Acidoferrales bacterium]
MGDKFCELLVQQCRVRTAAGIQAVQHNSIEYAQGLLLLRLTFLCSLLPIQCKLRYQPGELFGTFVLYRACEALTGWGSGHRPRCRQGREDN